MGAGPLRPEDLRFDPPSFPLDALAAAAWELFGVSGHLTPMAGERDQNSLVTAEDGRRFVLKVASPSEDPGTIELQCAAIAHVEATDPELPVPRLVPTVDGAPSGIVEIAGSAVPARMLTFLPGVTFEGAGPLSDRGLDGIGAFQARLVNALAGFDHPAASNFMPWALDSGMLRAEDLWANLPPASRSIAEPCRVRIAEAGRAVRGLRRQVVHNDGHRGNLLRADPASEAVTGVIDFGDLVETALAAELGISGASFLGGLPDPGGGLCALAGGFDRYRPLEDDEIALLPELVLARLALSTLLIEYQVAHTPHVADAGAAELPLVRRHLARWSALDADEVAERLHDHLQSERRRVDR